MSFDVNIGRSEPVIKPAAGMNNDGGSGGNTGYMTGGRRQKKEERKSLFEKNSKGDSFELSSGIKFEEDLNEKSWLGNFLKKFGN